MSIMQSERICLRPIEKKDLQKLNEWKNNESVYQNLGGGFMPVSIDVQEKWMDSLMDTTGKNKRFIIQTKENKAIGMIGLYDISWVHRTCELGIFIGDVEQQRKGYGQEAYLILESFAKNYLNLRKIKAYVVCDNGAAKKMYDRLGFLEVGKLKEERYINGSYHSVLVMEKFFSGGGYILLGKNVQDLCLQNLMAMEVA